jgi:hypothetical protein
MQEVDMGGVIVLFAFTMSLIIGFMEKIFTQDGEDVLSGGENINNKESSQNM